MKTNQFKLERSRNTSGDIVMSLYANKERVFATSSGYQLGCALLALGMQNLIHLQGTKTHLNNNEGGKILGQELTSSLEMGVFWSKVISVWALKKFMPGGDDHEYSLVAGLLPSHLITVPGPVVGECSEESMAYFKSFIHYPSA